MDLLVGEGDSVRGALEDLPSKAGEDPGEDEVQRALSSLSLPSSAPSVGRPMRFSLGQLEGAILCFEGRFYAIAARRPG